MLQVISTFFPAVLRVLLSGVLLTTGDVVFRFGMNSHGSALFGVAYIIYAAGVFCMTMSFFGQNIAVATLAAVLVNMITIAVVSAWYFCDEISIIQWSGMGLGIIALLLLEFYGR
jgi:hypothetical protein